MVDINGYFMVNSRDFIAFPSDWMRSEGVFSKILCKFHGVECDSSAMFMEMRVFMGFDEMVM